MAKRRMTKLNFKNRFNQPILGSDAPASLGELDLFSTIPHQNEIQGDLFDKVWPTQGSLERSNPDVTFQVHPSPHFTDLSSSFFEFDVKLEKLKFPTGKSATITADDKISVCNFVAATLWKDLSLSIAGTPVVPCHGLAMFENYLKLRTQCSTPALAKWEQAGWYNDKLQSEANPAGSNDEGIKARWSRFGTGQQNKLYFPIMTGVASQLRAVPSLVPLEIKLTKGPINWRLHGPVVADTEYDLTLVSAILHVRRYILYPSTLSRLEARLASSQAKIFFQVSYFPVRPSVHLSVRPSIRPSVCLSVCLSAYLSVRPLLLIFVALLT